MEHQDGFAQVDDKFIQLGYESAYMIENLGSWFFLFMMQVIVFLFISVISITFCHRNTRNWAKRKLDGIVFNSVLTVIDTSFLLLVMTATINVKNVLDGALEINMSFYFSTFSLTVCLLHLICTTCYLSINRKSLDKDSNKKRCGYIYMELRRSNLTGSITAL